MNEHLKKVEDLLKVTKLHEESGSIIYSGNSTLKKGKHYFLGTNPGGNKLDYKDTILNQLRLSGEKNEYFEGNWGNPQHQNNIIHLFNSLEIDLKKTFSTNTCFIRSPGEIAYSRDLKKDAEITFWPIQEYFLSIVKPKFIIANGSKARDLFWKKIFKNNFADNKVETDNKFKYKNSANKSCYLFYGDLDLKSDSLKNVTVLAMPHLSWKDIPFHKQGISWMTEKYKGIK